MLCEIYLSKAIKKKPYGILNSTCPTVPTPTRNNFSQLPYNFNYFSNCTHSFVLCIKITGVHVVCLLLDCELQKTRSPVLSLFPSEN